MSVNRKRKFSAGAGSAPAPGPKRARMNLGQQVRAQARLLASASELKNLDVDNTTNIVAGSGAGVLNLINGVAQGTTALTRLGRRITMRSLYWRWNGHLNATTVGGSGLRMLIVYDKQANVAAPVATDVLTVDAIRSPMNLSNSRRFVTLADYHIDCVGTAGNQAWMRTGYRKLNLNVEFNTGSTGTITDITSGSVYSIIYQDGNLATAVTASQLYTRIRFSDN